MTTIDTVTVTCAVCGETSQMVILTSSNTHGSPDMDARPAPMLRDTLPYQVQCCPGCGYCADSLAEAPAGAADFVRSSAYQQQLRDSALPALANQFLCRAMLAASFGDPASAGWDALHAAWVCDDTRPKAAPHCRQRAIQWWREALSLGQNFYAEPGERTDDPVAREFQHLLLADLLRRSAQFDAARRECEDVLSRDQPDFVRALLTFELQLVQAGDRACHNTSEARPV